MHLSHPPFLKKKYTSSAEERLEKLARDFPLSSGITIKAVYYTILGDMLLDKLADAGIALNLHQWIKSFLAQIVTIIKFDQHLSKEDLYRLILLFQTETICIVVLLYFYFVLQILIKIKHNI